MEKVLAVFNCLFCVIMTMAWTKKDIPNLIIKIGISGLAIANIIYALQIFGYVVKQ